MEKFQAHGILDSSSPLVPSVSSDNAGKWIQISPKKRGRFFSPSHVKKVSPSSTTGIRITDPLHPPLASQSLASKGKGKEVLGGEPSFANVLPPADLVPHSLSLEDAAIEVAPFAALEPTMVLPFLESTSSPPAALSPISVLSASEVFSSPAATPGEVDGMEHDRSKDFFIELADLDAPMGSTDSSKKRKLEEGLPFHPLSLYVEVLVSF